MLRSTALLLAAVAALCAVASADNCTDYFTSTTCMARYAPIEDAPHGCIWCGSDTEDGFGCMSKTSDDQGYCEVEACGNADEATAENDYVGEPNGVGECTVMYDGLTTDLGVSHNALRVVQLVELDASAVVTGLCLLFNITQPVTTPQASGNLNARLIFYTANYSNLTSRYYPGEEITSVHAESALIGFTDTGVLHPDLSISSTDLPVWGIVDRAFIGFEILDACPQLSLVPFKDPIPTPADQHTAYVWQTLNWTTNEGQWLHRGGGDSDHTAGFAINVQTGPGFCGDGFVSYAEDCDDNSSWTYFCDNCDCHPEHNGYFDGAKCACSYPLREIDPHGFVSPPAIVNREVDVPIYNATTGLVTIVIALPQTIPLRWGPDVNLVSTRTGDTLETLFKDISSPHFEMFPYACHWYGQQSWKLDDLIDYAEPVVVEFGPDLYSIQFAINVTWHENTTLAPNHQDYSFGGFKRFPSPGGNPSFGVHERVISARLMFAVHIQRWLDVESNVTVIDSTLMWAYVKRGFLVWPQGHGLPYYDVEIETRPKFAGLRIDESENSFFFAGKWGFAIKHVSNATVVNVTDEDERKDNFQRWQYRVYFDRHSICKPHHNNPVRNGGGDDESGPGKHDWYRMGFTLIAADPTNGVSTSKQFMNMQLKWNENWCAFKNSEELLVTGRQRTYPTQDFLVEGSTAATSTNFIRGAVVQVVVDAPESNVAQLQALGIFRDMRITAVELAGPALVNPTPAGQRVLAYLDFWSSAKERINPAEWTSLPTPQPPSHAFVNRSWEVTPYSCSATGIARGCYSLLLNNFLVRDGEDPLFIFTEVDLVLDEPVSSRKRADEPAAKARTLSAQSRITISKPLASSRPAATQAAGVVYRVTPAFIAAVASLAFVSVFSIASTIYFIRRRESVQL